MLVLTRRWNESIRIGEDVVVTVLSINQGNVRLGITAPRERSVVRTQDAIAELHSREGQERA